MSLNGRIYQATAWNCYVPDFKFYLTNTFFRVTISYARFPKSLLLGIVSGHSTRQMTWCSQTNSIKAVKIWKVSYPRSRRFLHRPRSSFPLQHYEPAELNPIKLTYTGQNAGSNRAWNRLGRYTHSPGKRAYCYAELNVSSLGIHIGPSCIEVTRY